MMSSLNVGDLGDAAQQAMHVLESLKRNNFDKFFAMKGIGGSMQRTILSIRRKSDKALKRVCSRKFTVTEYESIIKAYLVLDSIEKTYKIKHVEPGYSEDGMVFDTAGCIDGLAQRVGRFQLEDVDVCLHQAVVEHIFLDQQHKHKRNSIHSSNHYHQQHATGEDLDEVPLTILLRRLSAEHIPLCIVRSCELLADIVHTHYCISQWHAAPFDAQNHSAVFLHRDLKDNETERHAQQGTEESEDEDDEVEVFTSEVHHRNAATATSSTMHSPHLDFTFQRFSSAKLVIARESMRQSRTHIWEELLQGLIRLLRATTFSSEIKLEDFCSMSWALHVMILLGKEYCDCDCAALLHCLEEKSEEYFRNFHMENFTVVRMMIDAEMWNHIPIQLLSLTPSGSSNGNGVSGSSSILAAIKQSFGARKSVFTGGDNDRADDEEENDSSTSNTILGSFSEAGNPLKFVLRTDANHHHSHLSQRRTDRQVSHASLSDDDNDIDEDSGEEESPVLTPRVVRQALRRWDSDDFFDKNKDSTTHNSVKKKDADRSSFLITQTAFNGLGKSLAKYMQMMQLIPSAAIDIFDALTELLDFYLCAVFFGFVPAEERSKFFGTPNKMTSAAPDHQRDYEILKAYVSKAFNEVVYVPKGHVDPTVTINHLPSVQSHSSSEDLASVGSGAALSDNSSSNNLNNNSNYSSGNLDHNSQHSPNPTVHSPHRNQSFPTAAYDTVRMAQLLKIPAVIQDASTNSLRNCFALNQRIVAAESCWFVAQMLQDAKLVLVRLLTSEDNDAVNATILEKVNVFTSNYALVIGQLRALLYKINGPPLIDYAKTLATIVDCGWESKKLNADHHEWVDDLVDRCREVWDYMMMTDQFAEASSLVREQVWMELCTAAFEVTLEAYSKVKKCTPEGRAGMIMDVFALHDGLNNIHLCRSPRGKHYVDSYLQAFCLNEEDLMVWIQENYQTYAYRHIYGMLQQTLASMLNNKKLRDAVAVIDQLYDIDESVNSSSISGGVGSSFLSSSSHGINSISGGIHGGAGFNKLSNMISSSYIAGKFRK
jgi:hypothetical protein